MADKTAATETVKKVLFTALEALHDYLADIVIIGGWVPQIYAWKEKSGSWHEAVGGKRPGKQST